MGVKYKEAKFVKMIPNKLDYMGPVEMLTYYVVDYQMIESELPPKTLKVTIQLKRMVSQHLLSTYLPSLCILIIAQVFQLVFSRHIFSFPDNGLLQRRAFQDQYPSSHNLHVGHVHTQPVCLI